MTEKKISNRTNPKNQKGFAKFGSFRLEKYSFLAKGWKKVTAKTRLRYAQSQAPRP